MSKKEISDWILELTTSETPDITRGGKVEHDRAISNYKQVRKALEKTLDLKLDDNHLKMSILAGMAASKTTQNPDTFIMETKPLWSVRKEYLNLALKFLGKLNPNSEDIAGILLRPLPVTKVSISSKSETK